MLFLATQLPKNFNFATLGHFGQHVLTICVISLLLAVKHLSQVPFPQIPRQEIQSSSRGWKKLFFAIQTVDGITTFIWKWAPKPVAKNSHLGEYFVNYGWKSESFTIVCKQPFLRAIFDFPAIFSFLCSVWSWFFHGCKALS